MPINLQTWGLKVILNFRTWQTIKLKLNLQNSLKNKWGIHKETQISE